MIKFKDSMDPKSITVERDGEDIGFVQWHKQMSFVVFCDRFTAITENEIADIAKKMEAVRRNGWKK